MFDSDFFGAWNAVAVLIACIFKPDGFFGLVFAEHIRLVVFVTSRDKFFQPQTIEVMREIVKEIARPRVVAVAQDYLTLEVRFVVFELLFDVGKLSVKLVLLRRFCGVQTSVQRCFAHLASVPHETLLS